MRQKCGPEKKPVDQVVKVHPPRDGAHFSAEEKIRIVLDGRNRPA